MSKQTTLYAPDGRPYKTGSPREIVRLKARGYSETKPKGSDTKTTTTSSSGSSSSS